MADPDHEKKGGGGEGRHPDPEISGGVRSPKNISWPFKPQFFGLKIREGGRAPTLDPPLSIEV